MQYGKFIGVVTHVLLEDSTKGHAIFAENMLKKAQSLSVNLGEISNNFDPVS